MLERTRSLLRRLTGSALAEERRRWERFASQAVARVHLSVHDAESIAAEIRDVSRAGISLAVARSVDSGTMLRLNLPSATPSVKTTVLACVAHVRPKPGGTFILGCKFSTELNDDDLEALGAKRERSKDGDKRAWERVAATGQALYKPVESASEPRGADIHNLSPTGVALHAKEELIPGTLLDLDLRDSGGRTVVTIIACVVYLTTAGDGQWLAGCNFIRELHDEDLSALIAPTPESAGDPERRAR